MRLHGAPLVTELVRQRTRPVAVALVSSGVQTAEHRLQVHLLVLEVIDQLVQRVEIGTTDSHGSPLLPVSDITSRTCRPREGHRTLSPPHNVRAPGFLYNTRASSVR